MIKGISLKSLTLKNFKGIKDLHVDFADITNVYGDNGTGKTTIFDAFTWLLFDKDSTDRKKFSVKTIDEEGNERHRLEHSVEGVLDIGGKEIRLSKTLTEKWVRKRGEINEVNKGDETTYMINDVPVKQSEYMWQIEQEIAKEQALKMLSNPFYFARELDWKKRREVLFEIVGDVTDQEVIESKSGLSILTKLLGDESIENLKKSVAARRKKLKEKRDTIPVRIDEINNSIVVFKGRSKNLITSEIESLKSELDKIESCILDASKIDDEKLKIQEKVYNLKSKIKDLEYQARAESEKPLSDMKLQLSNIKFEKKEIESTLEQLIFRKNDSEKQIENIALEVTNLREKWNLVNQEELHIDEDNFICPTCKRKLEDWDIEQQKKELQDNFNMDKTKRLSTITEEGKKKSSSIAAIKEAMEDVQSEIDRRVNKLEILNPNEIELERNISEFKPIFNDSFKREIEAYEKEIEALKVSEDNSRDELIQGYKKQKQDLQFKLEELNRELFILEQNKKSKERMDELINEEKEISELLAELEKQEFACENFIKTKAKLLEERINEKFKFVKFRLFKHQKNGGIEEVCEVLVDGVPFEDANNASKINAGIDVINTLSEHFKVQVPIFVDNRESVNELINCNTQLVNLIVSKDEELKVEVA